MTYQNEHKFEELAKEIEKIDAPFYKEIVHRLRSNAYHDFLNERFPAPKLQMIADFSGIERDDVVEAIKNGDYDQ